MRLHVRRDAAVCRNLAHGAYSPDLGARSLNTAVKEVEDMLVEAYLGKEEAIAENTCMRDFSVDVKNDELVVNLG